MLTTVTDFQKNKTISIIRDSGSVILFIDYDHSIKSAKLTIYETYFFFKNKMSLWQRLLYCLKILLYKRPHIDQICLNNYQLLDLKNFLATLELKHK